MFDSHKWVHRDVSSSKGYDVQPYLLIHRKQSVSLIHIQHARCFRQLYHFALVLLNHLLRSVMYTLVDISFPPQTISQFFANTPPHLTAQSNALNWRVVTQCDMWPKDLVSHALAPCDETCSRIWQSGEYRKNEIKSRKFFFKEIANP